MEIGRARWLCRRRQGGGDDDGERERAPSPRVGLP
jgi:hypothetical protein